MNEINPMFMKHSTTGSL